MDVRVAASVGVAQRRQCLVDGGGGLGAALFEARWLSCWDRRTWPWCAPLPHRGGGLAGGVAQPLVGAATVSARAGAAPTASTTARHMPLSSSTGHGSVDDGAAGVGARVVSHGGVQGIQPASESRPLPLPATSIAAAMSARVSRLSVNT